MYFDCIILIVCNIFLINISTNVIIKEDLENNVILKDDDWLLVRVSIITIIVLLIFELKTNFFMFLIIFVTLIVPILDHETIKKLNIINKNISKK